MKYLRRLLSYLVWTVLFLPAVSYAQYPWSGIISPARAANWSNVGIAGGIPDSSWTQCGSTIAAYGSTSSYASPATIQNAINACGTDQYVLLGAGDFYLSGPLSLKSGAVIRGAGANQTRLHFNGSLNCNGVGSAVCMMGSNTYGGSCNTSGWWSCPSGQFATGYQHSANWTGSYAQGASTITLDSVTGIVTNLTPIVLDQCDTGMSGNAGDEGCNRGSGGAITAATVYSGGGGTGYSVGDTGTIGCAISFGECTGSGTATYNVTSVSGGAVTGFSITSAGSDYSYTNLSSYGAPTPTTPTSGSGSGFEVQITAVTPYDNNGFFVCAITMICEDQGDAGTSRPARSQAEIVIATAISGTGPYTVTLSHPLMHPNWSSAQTPQAWWGSSTIANAGVEDVLLDVSAVTASCVAVNSAYEVWVKGIACNTANFFHVYAWVASNLVVRDSYFYWTKYGATTSYGIGSAGQVGNSLFENNIIQGVVDPLNPDGACTGCVFAYNYSVNDWYGASTYMLASSPMHAAGSDYILEEGNVGSGTNQDSIHGPHLANTFFRNYLNGYESNNGTMPTYNTTPVTIAAFSRYNNYLANVLGTAAYHTIYQCVPTTASTSYCTADPNGGGGPAYHHVWDIGWSHGGGQLDYNNNPPLPNDMLTITSLYRYGNYDVVNNAVQWNYSEVPTADPNFPNSVPGSNTFPASFYNGVTAASPSCGTGLSFWKNPSAGTCPPYPPIGPDVVSGDIGMCTSGTYQWSRALTGSQCAGGSFTASVNGGYGNSNPAMRCYLNQMSGTPDGTGPMLSFSRASCYALDTAGNNPAPQPPTGVTGAVVPTP
jgi:hypothetical protein